MLNKKSIIFSLIKNKTITKIFSKIFLLLFFIFSLDTSFCEECSSENTSENTFKRAIIYSFFALVTIGLCYYFFTNINDNGNNNQIFEESLELIKNIPKDVKLPKPVRIYISPDQRVFTTPYDFYMLFDPARLHFTSINTHLSQISNEIMPYHQVYQLDIPIVYMSNTLLNTISTTATKLNPEAIFNLPDENLIAFAHFSPLCTDKIYYQILTAGEFQKFIIQFNMLGTFIEL